MSAAHDTAIDIGGDTYWVRRDFDLMRRIEQAFGPLAELSARLQRASVAVDDLVKLYGIALASQAARPPVEHVREHVFDAGVAASSDQIAMLVLQLFHGDKRTLEWLQAEAAKGGGEENPPQAA